MKFFGSKKTSKKHNSVDEDEEDDYFHHSQPASPNKSPTKSPTKPFSASPRAESPSSRESKPRPPRALGRHPTDPGSSSSSRRKKLDPDTHPLNLPPEQRKRLSALSAMSGRNSMDIDKEPLNGGTPSSPPPQPQPQPQHQPQEQPQQQPQQQTQQSAQQQQQTQQAFQPAPHLASPPPPLQQPVHTNSFTVPVTTATATNGPTTNGDIEEVPVPPPHRAQPSNPSQTTADDAENFKNEGNKFFKAKDYTRAIEFYTKAVVLHPESATYLSNRAAAYMSAGRYEDALEDCRKASILDPKNAKILLRLARIYTSLGLPEEAISTFGRIHPPPSAKDMATAREMLQHLNAAKGASQDGTAASMVLYALDKAERLLGVGALKPRKWQLMRGEALLKMADLNSLGEAQNIAMSLLRHNSQDPEGLVLRGRALYAQGENDKAVQHFRKALSCDPDFKDAIKWLRIVQKLDRMKEDGNADYKACRWQAAIDKYTAALEIDPANRGTNSKILQNRALCKIRLRQFDDAIADCDKAFSLDPSYTKARKTKANALGQAERWEDAIREWKSIQEIEPDDRSIAKEIRKAELELKKAQRKDYYKILGIEKSADDNAIKKAYRKLAIIHHPDKNPGDQEAEARFKDISEAYETLSDPQKRARYDSGEDLADMSDMFGGGGGMHGGIDPEILFSMMGGQGGGFGGGFPGGGFPGGGGFSFGEGGQPFGGGRQRQRGGFNFNSPNFS